MRKKTHIIIPQVIGAVIICTLILAPIFHIARAALNDDLQKQIDGKKAQIQALEKQLSSLRNAIKNQQSQRATLQRQINLIESQINQLETEIQLTSAKIGETNLEIEKLENNIKQKQDEISLNKIYLANAIRLLHEYDQETTLELVLKNESFSDMLNQVQYADNLQEAVHSRLKEMKDLKEQLTRNKQEQEDFKNSLLTLNEELRGKNIALSFQRNDKEDLLISTRSQEKKYQAQLSELEKKRQETQKEIYLLEDKLRMAIDPSSIPPARKGLLAWPVRSYLTQGYGPTSQTGFINNVYSFHNGIDLGVSIGTPIKAAYDGTISGIGDCGKYAYGKWITVNHHNGLTTLYGHLSSLKVSKGQAVKRGEVIGYSGNTGFSTGPHLHFTVYATNTFSIESRWYGLLPMGGSINPMNYLE